MKKLDIKKNSKPITFCNDIKSSTSNKKSIVPIYSESIKFSMAMKKTYERKCSRVLRGEAIKIRSTFPSQNIVRYLILKCNKIPHS